MAWRTLLGAWIAALSLLAFTLAVVDKGRARRGGSRIPERVLLGAALLGGTPGLALGMGFARHKTRKATFILKFALIVAAQVVLALWLRSRGAL